MKELNEENHDLNIDKWISVGSITIDKEAIQVLQFELNGIVRTLDAANTLCNWHGKAKISFRKRGEEIDIVAGPPDRNGD